MPRLKDRRVLLVEDELLIALDLQLTIEDEGGEVTLAEGVDTGLAAIAQHVETNKLPHVALLDVRLADGDVFPLADELSAVGVPIVFHSGHAQGSDLARGYPNSVILSKPAATEALVMALARRAL